jgi:hypothetical protein
MKVFVFIDILARILGIGPRTGVLETLILPLNYIRMHCIKIDLFKVFCQGYKPKITV